MEQETQHRYGDKIKLFTFETIAGRNISFAVTGDPQKGKRVAFFYPMGANRRFLIHLNTLANECNLHLICVNRPGCGQTDYPVESVEQRPKNMVDNACKDLLSVMKFLEIDKLDGLFSMCAGNTFALAFVSQYPDKFNDGHGKIFSVASYVSPADCPEAKKSHRFGATYVPVWISSLFAGSSMSCMQWGLRNFPSKMVLKSLNKQFVGEEKEFYDTKIADKEELVEHLQWMAAETPRNFIDDLSVQLSPSYEMGIDYKNVTGKVLLFHGEKDRLAPIGSVEWLAKQLPQAKVVSIPNATHDGTIFMLHSQMEDNLKAFF